MRYSEMDSPVGRLTIAEENDRLRFILLGTENRPSDMEQGWSRSESVVIEETMRQLRSYFTGKLTRFNLPLGPEGTPFQLEVWSELLKIPYGSVISYGELASRIGKPKACRAVGAANGSNPIPIVIPCHRVIGSSGKMVGYSGGLWIKEALLELENTGFNGNKDCRLEIADCRRRALSRNRGQLA